MEKPKCSICSIPLSDPQFARNYPNLVCRRCDSRAVNVEGQEPRHNSVLDYGDNPVFIDGLKCWRRYRFGGFVTMRDVLDCSDLSEFYRRCMPGF